MTDPQRYRRYEQQRRLLTLRNAHQWAHTDAVAQYLYLKAKLALCAASDDWEPPAQQTRRHQIFLAFRAESYRNPVTRRSIVLALKNANYEHRI